MTAANFARLDVARPEVSRLVTAMLQARQAVFSVRGHIRKKTLPMIGGRMCWRTPVPADKREAATAVVL
jgi:hypothetical protein